MATIASLFGRHTPFAELQQHMRTVVDCVQHLPLMLQAIVDDDADRAKAEAKQIFALEDQADALKHSCRLHLPRRLLMPVDRRDLLEILQYQDTIADRAEDVAGVFLQRQMPLPQEISTKLVPLAEQCVVVVTQTAEVVELFDELLVVGFRGRVVKQVEQMVDAINLAEDQADRLEREVSRLLFSVEHELDPVSVILWYRVLEWIGDVADYAEKVSNNFRLLIAR